MTGRIPPRSRLDRHGQAVLEALSSQIRGHMLLAADQRPPRLPSLKVDKIVTDGIIFIPMGLTEGDVKRAGRVLQHHGPDRERQGKRNANPNAPRSRTRRCRSPNKPGD